jgi:hypothetical protein
LRERAPARFFPPRALAFFAVFLRAVLRPAVFRAVFRFAVFFAAVFRPALFLAAFFLAGFRALRPALRLGAAGAPMSSEGSGDGEGDAGVVPESSGSGDPVGV